MKEGGELGCSKHVGMTNLQRAGQMLKAAKARGKPYTIVFVGVNGVGKSTNLAKVAYWLLQNDVSVRALLPSLITLAKPFHPSRALLVAGSLTEPHCLLEAVRMHDVHAVIQGALTMHAGRFGHP
jgi:hypothetical protein